MIATGGGHGAPGGGHGAPGGHQRSQSSTGSGDPGLPAEVERLLQDVVADGFVLYRCGPETQPRALLASYAWPDHVDLVTIRSFDQITTARIPTPHPSQLDIFAPETVVWAYQGPPRWALQALLDLVHPRHPDAPHGAYPAPRALRIPRAEQRPLTIRPPSPGRAGVRARRLAQAITPSGPGGGGDDTETWRKEWSV